MRNRLFFLLMLCCSAAPATAQVSIGIGLPNVSIGINLQTYPQLVPVPGFPVYYAPQLRSNYFFYDGVYWIYQDDRWYASSWYNGPWAVVAPEVIPVFVLRVPVRYYRRPPPYFRGWQPDAPPRWGQHWGNEWKQRRSGWDRWDHSSAPPAAPLPVYQRRYIGDRYPRVEQQEELQVRNYGYRPQDPLLREHYDARRAQGAPPPQRARESGQHPPNGQHPPASQAPPQMRGTSAQQQSQQPQQRAAPQQQRAPESRHQEAGSQGKGAPQQPQRGQGPGQEKDGDKADDHGQGRK